MSSAEYSRELFMAHRSDQPPAASAARHSPLMASWWGLFLLFLPACGLDSEWNDTENDTENGSNSSENQTWTANFINDTESEMWNDSNQNSSEVDSFTSTTEWTIPMNCGIYVRCPAGGLNRSDPTHGTCVAALKVTAACPLGEPYCLPSGCAASPTVDCGGRRCPASAPWCTEDGCSVGACTCSTAWGATMNCARLVGSPCSELECTACCKVYGITSGVACSTEQAFLGTSATFNVSSIAEYLDGSYHMQPQQTSRNQTCPPMWPCPDGYGLSVLDEEYGGCIADAGLRFACPPSAAYCVPSGGCSPQHATWCGGSHWCPTATYPFCLGDKCSSGGCLCTAFDNIPAIACPHMVRSPCEQEECNECCAGMRHWMADANLSLQHGRCDSDGSIVGVESVLARRTAVQGGSEACGDAALSCPAGTGYLCNGQYKCPHSLPYCVEGGCTSSQLAVCPDGELCAAHLPWCKAGMCYPGRCQCENPRSLGEFNCHFLLRSPCSDFECDQCCQSLMGYSGHCEGGESATLPVLGVFEGDTVVEQPLNASEAPIDCDAYLRCPAGTGFTALHEEHGKCIAYLDSIYACPVDQPYCVPAGGCSAWPIVWCSGDHTCASSFPFCLENGQCSSGSCACLDTMSSGHLNCPLLVAHPCEEEACARCCGTLGFGQNYSTCLVSGSYAGLPSTLSTEVARFGGVSVWPPRRPVECESTATLKPCPSGWGMVRSCGLEKGYDFSCKEDHPYCLPGNLCGSGEIVWCGGRHACKKSHPYCKPDRENCNSGYCTCHDFGFEQLNCPMQIPSPCDDERCNNCCAGDVLGGGATPANDNRSYGRCASSGGEYMGIAGVLAQVTTTKTTSTTTITTSTATFSSFFESNNATTTTTTTPTTTTTTMPSSQTQVSATGKAQDFDVEATTMPSSQTQVSTTGKAQDLDVGEEGPDGAMPQLSLPWSAFFPLFLRLF